MLQESLAQKPNETWLGNIAGQPLGQYALLDEIPKYST